VCYNIRIVILFHLTPQDKKMQKGQGFCSNTVTNQKWAGTASKIFLQKAVPTYELIYQILHLKQLLTCVFQYHNFTKLMTTREVTKYAFMY